MQSEIEHFLYYRGSHNHEALWRLLSLLPRGTCIIPGSQLHMLRTGLENKTSLATYRAGKSAWLGFPRTAVSAPLRPERKPVQAGGLASAGLALLRGADSQAMMAITPVLLTQGLKGLLPVSW